MMVPPPLGPGDVDMALPPETRRRIKKLPGFSEQQDVMIHYTITEKCPFRCRGCINALTAAAPHAAAGPEQGDRDPVRDGRGIVRLIHDSGKERAVVVFYGGEPMLRPGRMRAVFDSVDRENDGRHQVDFMVITSGHYLSRSAERHPEMMKRLWLTAVSVDGTTGQHNAMRQGTDLERIRAELADFNRRRTGDVLIWSTLRPEMSLADCFASYRYFLDRGEAEHFFWHWDEAEGVIDDLDSYRSAYRADLEAILAEYLARLGHGELLSILHVNELLLFLLTGRHRGTTACAVEEMANFDIGSNGRVHACADLPETMDIGRIESDGRVRFRKDARQRLEHLVKYKHRLGCRTCGVEPYCGGRCPVQIHLGGIERAKQYCLLMRDHVKSVKAIAPKVVDAMLANGQSLQALYASARLAKYTDVTP
jgi:radical SAM protein with 4Fe4S-binding SPASM domain